jgi:NAD(P)H-quinone oxidoreductase subunit 3
MNVRERRPDRSPAASTGSAIRRCGKDHASLQKGVRLTGIWYVVGFAFAGVSFVFLTIAAAWLVSHRNRGDVHKGLPYESGIDTYGDTHGRFGLSFYIYALLFVAFDIEVIFIYLWAIAFDSLLLGGLVSMLIFVAILLLGLAYAWRKGALTWR